jgi:hypothetical protein
MPDFHNAIGHDVLQEPAETRHDGAMGGAWPCTARLTGGEGAGTVLEAHETAVGAGDLEDGGGEGGEGGVAVVMGLTVDVPGDGPHLGIAGLQQSGVAQVFLEDGAGAGGEGCDGDKDVGAGGPPGRAVLCEATAGPNGMDRRVGRAWPAPRRPDTGASRERCPEDTLGCGEPREGCRRGGEHGVVREALRRAEAGAACLRHGAGEQEVRPGQWLLQVVGEPLLGGMRLTRGTGPVATGMLDAVGSPTA